jgi:hypothetical protein
MKKSFYTLVFVLCLKCIFCINNSVAQWEQVTNGINSSMNIYSLTSLGNNIFSGSDSGVYISTNNGSSWVITALNNKITYSLAVSGTVIYAGTSTNGVYSTSNNGVNWTQTSLNNQTIYALIIDGNNIFAGASGNGVYLSTNNGSTWTQNTLGSHTVLSLAASGTNIYAGTSINGIYRSTNSGTNWAQTLMNYSSPKSLAINSSYCFAGLYSLSGSNGLYRSTDGGTWTLAGLNGINVLSLGLNGNNLFAGTENGVYLSTNNGTNWIIKNQGFSSVPHIEAILITNNYLYAGTYAESVWKRSLSEIIGIRNISTEIPSKYSLSQNYPNPFNPATNIRFEIPKSRNIKLVVFDALGREVETLVNGKQAAGTYEATFNALQYTSGVYFYRLTSEGYSETKKMILIK